MAEPVLCPEINHEQSLITLETLDALKLTTEDRRVGTVVTVTCLSSDSHALIGESVLRCTKTGQWNHDIPKCVSKIFGEIIIEPGETGSQGFSEDFGMLPFIVAVSLLGVTCVLLTILSAYLIRLNRKVDKAKSGKDRNISKDNSFMLNLPCTDYVTQSWVELASTLDGMRGQGHIQSPDRGQSELTMAMSRDAVPETTRHTHFDVDRDWSGY